jgi:hypothetical protein
MPTDPLTELFLGALAAGACAGLVRPCRQLLQRSLGDEQKTARTRRELMILGGLALTIAAGWLTADLAGHHQDSTMRRQALVRTELGAATIETDLVRQLHWNEQDLSNPAYLHLKHLMRAFPRANPDLRFAELMGVREGRTYFLADSEPPNSPDYSPPGQFYEEAEASYLAAVARHEPFVLGPIADRWGVWITASVPVVDLNQDRSWVTFDLDLSADGWDARIRQARLPVILITLLLAVLGVMFHQAQEQIRATLAQVVQSEQALLAAKEAAEAATRAKSDFLAVMSHEIRTPIGGVIGLLDMLRRLPQPTQQRYYTDLARDNAEALLEILDDVLDTAKVESGKLSFESIPFRLRAEFHRVLEALRLRAEAKGLALEWKVDPDVPEVLTGDPTRLRQIVANLVSNAIKFTARGGIHVTAQRDPPATPAPNCVSASATPASASRRRPRPGCSPSSNRPTRPPPGNTVARGSALPSSKTSSNAWRGTSPSRAPWAPARRLSAPFVSPSARPRKWPGWSRPTSKRPRSPGMPATSGCSARRTIRPTGRSCALSWNRWDTKSCSPKTAGRRSIGCAANVSTPC